MPSLPSAPALRHPRRHFVALPEHLTSASMPGKYRDPWAAREAWRRHPIFSMRFYARNMFPGLGWATGAFVLCEYLGECFDGRRCIVVSEAHHISVSFVSPARPHRRHIGTPKQHREAQGGRQEAAWRGVALKASFFRSVTTGRSRPSIDVYKPFVHEVWRAIRQWNSQEHFIRWIQ